jgi:hypothetical protein
MMSHTPRRFRFVARFGVLILVAGLLSGCIVVEPHEGHHGGCGWWHCR